MGISLKRKIFNSLFKTEISAEFNTQLNEIKRATIVAMQERFYPGMLLNSYRAIKDTEAYVCNADAYAIIRRIAKTAAMIPIIVYKVKDEKALKEYEFATKASDYSPQALLKKHILKTKALEPVKDDHPLSALLKNPNPHYSETDFKEGVYIFRLSTGNTMVYTPKLEFGVNAGKPGEMWVLPPQYTQPKIQRGNMPMILSWELNMGMTPLKIPLEEIIHLKYFNTDFSTEGAHLLGLSPLRAGSKVLKRGEAEENYTVNSFENSGISGIVSNESVDLDDSDQAVEATGKMKSDFYSEATGVRNARKLLFLAGKVTYTGVGLGPVDMQVIESQRVTFKKFCNLYGISDILFNNDESNVKANVQEMVRALYTNAALPEVYAWRDALNQYVCPLYKGEKLYVDVDISGISELQEDMKKMADIFSSLPIMIPNLILEAFNYGKSADPNMDKVFVKTGYTDLESLLSIGDLPIVTPDGN